MRLIIHASIKLSNFLGNAQCPENNLDLNVYAILSLESFIVDVRLGSKYVSAHVPY